MKKRLRKFYRKAANLLLKITEKQIIFIHTPKCGGTYIVKQYKLQENPRVKNVGHSSMRELNLNKRAKVVGLIREPLDWYQSYYFFCKKALELEVQSEDNFPETHPISAFSKNATVEFKDMIKNMDNQNFVKNISQNFDTARIYSHDIKDVYQFIERTQTGFWTWTMLYHFSSIDTVRLRTKSEVIKETKTIAQNINFIHQENIDEEVEKNLKLKKSPGTKKNVSHRHQLNSEMKGIKRIISKLDGDVARILGNY